MQEEGLIQVTASTAKYACLLKACASVGALKRGRQCHGTLSGRGLQADPIVDNSLVDQHVCEIR